MDIYTISTLNDWAHFCGTAGPVGIERIFDRLTEARVKRIYWRLFEGGIATYPSKVAPVLDDNHLGTPVGDGGGPSSRHYTRRFECRSWDPLAMAVEVGRRRGIEVFAWWTVCEEDHGGKHLSGFGGRADLQCHDRAGTAYPGTLDFFFDEVRDYKHRILDEVLERDVDGLLLDFARHNATPSGDAQGVHRFGYNPPIRAAFAEQHGGSDPIDLPADDPDWLKFKLDYRADFVRSIRAKLPADRPMDLMTPPDFDQVRWLCLDLPGLTKDGTFDRVMPFSMTYDSSPEATRRDIEALQSQVRGKKSRVAGAVQMYWGVDVDALQDAVVASREAGANAVVYYEAHHLAETRYITAVRAANLGAMPTDRSVKVKRLKRTPTAKDWDKAERHEGFFIAAGKDQLRPSAKTAFSVIAGPKHLHVRLIAEGQQGELDPKRLARQQVFIDILDARNYWMMNDTAHFFVDPAPGSKTQARPTRRDFQHFSIQRDGTMRQETRHNNDWHPQWGAEVDQPGKKRWEAYWHLPYATIGGKPKAGDRWGFQLAREQNATKEGSTWFVSTAYGYDPAEWGDLIFA